MRESSPTQNVTCHISHVTGHVSHVACHKSHVMCHMSHIFFYFFFPRGVKLIGTGSVINGAYRQYSFLHFLVTLSVVKVLRRNMSQKKQEA